MNKQTTFSPLRSEAGRRLGERLLVASAVALLLALLPAGKAAAGVSPPGLNRWPTLQEQLDQAHVAPGTALARLIHDNQDFRVLDPHEMHDNLPYPAWLRINYRAGNPEFRYSPTDPTHGYPHVLHEIYEWMVAHPELIPGSAGTPGLGGSDTDSPTRSPSASASIPDSDTGSLSAMTATVGSNLRMSGAQTSSRSESDVRINYWDPTKIISASNNISASGMQAEFYSTNGGGTWGQSYLPLTASDAFHSDPTVEWTSDGTAWSATLGITSNGRRLYLRLYSSADNGLTWNFVGTGNGSMRNADKEMHWADHSASSPYLDNQYFIWHEGTTCYMNTFSSGTFGTPIRVDGSETTGTPIGADVTSNASGDAFGAWPDTGSRGIYIVKSATGGSSWNALGGSPVRIVTTYDSYDIGVPSFNSRRALIYVSIGAYRNATTNNVYAAWTDLSGDGGCTSSANEPGSNTGSTCKTRIWFARSTDGGTTWSSAVRLNHQSSRNDQFNQDLVVDPTSGEIAVMYYDTVGDPNRLKTDVWIQRSCDGGVSWTAAQKVTAAMTDETAGTADGGNQYGDYNGVSAYAGKIFPSWTDRRNNAKEEIWTAPVTSDIPVAPAGLTATVNGSNIDLAWTAVTGATSYQIYRAIGSCPQASYTLLQAGVATSSYSDTTAVAGTTYAYVVVATGGDLSCDGPPSGCASATVPSCTAPGTPTGLTLTTPVDNSIHLAWTAGTPAGATYNVYRASGATCTGATLLASGIATTTYDDTSVSGGSAYSYQVSAVDGTGSCESSLSSCQTSTATGGPGVYSNGTFAAGTPRDTTSGQDVRWIYNSGATALAPPTTYTAVYSVSNDRRLHSMNVSVPGGDWPETSPKAWKPPAMNAPAQGRTIIIPTTLYPIGGSTRVVFVSSQDGHVYCFDADTGAQLWMSGLLGDMVQAPVAVAFRQYKSTIGGMDLVFAATRNSSAGNVIYALNAATGATVWSFDNGGGSNAIGVVTAMPGVDPVTQRLFFTSRAMTGGSQDTVWCLNYTAAGGATVGMGGFRLAMPILRRLSASV